MPVRLIINADDFGLTEGVNNSILELFQAGVLSSASLMATGPAFRHAAALAAANPGLGVGCHLVFVDGLPISHPESIPSLLGGDGKHFRTSLAEFALDLYRHQVRPDDIAREAQAQIQRLQRAGIDVTHIDTHKHTHVFPTVLRAVLHVAGRCGVTALRFPFEPSWSVRQAHAPFLRRLSLRLLRRFCRDFERSTRTLHDRDLLPEGTLGIAATGTLTPETLTATLRSLARHAGPDALFELCCHPGHVDPALHTLPTRLRASRELEHQALLEVIPAFLNGSDAPTLVHFGHLGVPGLQRLSGQYHPSTGFEPVC